jgi:hypothetical protein
MCYVCMSRRVRRAAVRVQWLRRGRGEEPSTGARAFAVDGEAWGWPADGVRSVWELGPWGLGFTLLGKWVKQ